MLQSSPNITLNSCFFVVCSDEEWQELVSGIGLDSIQLRDARYDQVVHLMTAANGAESFYQTSNNSIRSEGIDLARKLDHKAAQVRLANTCSIKLDLGFMVTLPPIIWLAPVIYHPK